MTEPERKRLIDKVKEMVHQKPDIEMYNTTIVRDNTNCYSYAIGSTYPYLQLYRIGAICDKKPIEQEYFSIEEIKKLLFEDFKILGLKIEKSSVEEQIEENQYKIALYVKIYADDKIHDFHFLRYENRKWSEKYRTQFPRILGESLEGLYSNWPWNFVGVFKITR